MTLQRDLAWSYLTQLYRSSISYHFARYALALTYDLLPSDVVHQAKRCVLDTLGCAIGALDAPGLPMCETVATQMGGPPEATIFGSGRRTSALNATLVNSFLVRFLDYNDIGGGGHNSDSIPAILAVAERERASGRDLITSIVISYELGARFSVAAGLRGVVGDKGWTPDIRGGLNMPPALGKLMGLDEDQIANAIGLTTCHCLPLGILDTDKEENFMSKNLRFGWVAYDAILACLLAKQGFTGPVRVVEGENGLLHAVLHGHLDREHLLDFSGWRILDTRHKILCLNGGTIAHVLATLAIVRENNLHPEDIATVRIWGTPHEAEHTTVLPKKYARNAETADHSAFFANAVAIKDRAFGPDSFDPRNFTDPVVLALVEKITVQADPTLPTFGGMSEITTTDGRVFRHRIERLHGFGDDPLSDVELEDKFTQMAARYMPPEHIRALLDTVWRLDTLADVNELTAQMAIRA